MTHAIRRSVEFGQVASKINSDLQFRTRAHLRALYEPNPALASEDAQVVATELKQCLHRPSSPDDTHPSPAERFELTRRVHSAVRMESDGLVWDLFADKQGLIQETVKELANQVGLDKAAATASGQT